MTDITDKCRFMLSQELEWCASAVSSCTE